MEAGEGQVSEDKKRKIQKIITLNSGLYKNEINPTKNKDKILGKMVHFLVSNESKNTTCTS